MGDVVRLFPSRGVYDGLVCACGETWFDVTVVLDKDARITGWGTVAMCIACNQKVTVQKR